MKDRLDLEEDVLSFYNFAENVDTVANYLMESEGVDSDLCDKVVNALNGISALMKIQTDKTFDTLRQCFRLDEYKDQPLTQIDTSTIMKKKCGGNCNKCDPTAGMTELDFIG